MSQIPTILVGLGGTGSKIVDKIYARLPEENKRLVAIHAFDTDVNDIGNLTHLTKDEIVQTSTNYTVGQYLSIADPVVKEWFPHEIKELHRKNLTDGAGQIRAVSRLAYRAAMESNALQSLQKSISKIRLLCEEDRLSGIRVMIVSTLAGGTGAGIFLQTAMYIRELLNSDFGQENVLIRGVFLLPDILVLSNTVDKQEFDNLQSNAYSCLKELNAIMRVTNNGSENLQIEMEYKPNQTDDDGRKTLNLSFKNLPYDYCVLYDYENEDGKNIGKFENYINMVSRTTYFDLFTPMSHRLFSKQDNQIRELAKAGGLNRYCSSSLASIVYPYNDMVNYMALRWVTSFLSDQWLIVDEKVQEEYKVYQYDLNRGVNRDTFNYGERFIKNIDELSQNHPFFRSLIREINLVDEKNTPIALKSDEYLTEVSQRIQNLFDNDNDILETERLCRVREDELKESQTAQREVNRVEGMLREYKTKLTGFITNNKNLLVDSVLLNDMRNIIKLGSDDDFANYQCHNKFELNHWLLNASSPVHPLTVRYILFDLINKLDFDIKSLTRETDELMKAINNYEEKAYDLPQTDALETAEDRIRHAQRQNMLSKVFSTNLFKEFMEEFLDKSAGQLMRLNKYRMKKLQLEAFQLMKNYLNDLSEDFKKYFDILLNIKNNLSKELNHLAKLHDESSDPTILYTLSGSDDKQKLWLSISGNYAEEGLPEAISKQIYMSMYYRLCKRTNRIYTSALQEDTIESTFRDTVLGWCRNKLYKEERLDISIFEALQKEAEYNAIDEKNIDDYKSRQIQNLDNLAKPFIMKPVSLKVAEISAWGVHSSIQSHFSPKLINNTFGQTEIIQSDAFSRYEIVKEKMIYGLKAEDLVKFMEPDGRYYRAYSRIINQMRNNSNVVTPHLDKRWHLPAYLPSLTTAGIENDANKINRAFVIGLSMGYLCQLDNYGSLAWYYKGDPTGMQMINKATDIAAGPNAHELYKALYYNPAIVDKVLDKFEVDKHSEKSSKPDISNHTFYNNISSINIKGTQVNLMQCLLSYPDDVPGDYILIEESLGLIKKACEEIASYFVFVIGVHREAEAKRMTKAFIEALQNNAAHYYGADKHSTRFAQWETAFQLVK